MTVEWARVVVVLSDGTAMGFCTKFFPVTHWPGLVVCRGASLSVALLGYQLAFKFKDFDSLIEGVEAALPAMAKACDVFTQACGTSRIEAILGGWSRKRDRPEVNWQINVIDDSKTVNAFATPGGYLYVYSGLIMAADNEAELAGVMAHETGHVVARHSARQMVDAYGLSARQRRGG